MKYLISLLATTFGFYANAELVKTATVVGGESFKFVMTTYSDCNGSGFDGVDLKLLSKKNKIKVYKVEPKWGPVTLMDCGDSGGTVQVATKTYHSKADETVIFLLNDEDLSLELSK